MADELLKTTHHSSYIKYEDWFHNAHVCAPSVVEPRTALQRFESNIGTEDYTPIERLRFFCSLAMSPQDWLDAEAFFDAMTEAHPPSVVEPVALVVSKYGDPESFGEREIEALSDLNKIPYNTKLYTATPIRAPLTDGQIISAMESCLDAWDWKEFARTIEAAHGIAADRGAKG